MDETPYRFEPAFLEEDVPSALVGLATEIAQSSARLPGRLPAPAAAELADLVRIMNCYYSNLIEGHATRPIDIEKALARPLVEARPLLQEARAHIEVQKHIDDLAGAAALPLPTSVAFLKDLHRRLYERMPTELRIIESATSQIEIEPGAFRNAAAHDVAVGIHVPPSSERVPAFMRAFEERFAKAAGHPGQKILAIPAAHHRLAYIHPFIDGNGRVGRLMSHAMCQRAGIGANGLWSISRGLARGLEDRSEYKQMMRAADAPRRGERDGRGNLSRAALIDFSEWFLKIALDQISFCAQAFDLDALAGRYQRLADLVFEGKTQPGRLIIKTLELGELARGDAALIVGSSERTARTIVAACTARGFLKSDTPKGPLRVGFPVQDRAYLFPGLFADEPLPGPPANFLAPAPPGRSGIGD